ncbi:hypothetical protein, partial [Raoultella ornithinolytica]|uniref:hypothetical protein n=1 Tax=Raoultella ornithinolytica TaxID=54291 RepID=UPI0019D18B06
IKSKSSFRLLASVTTSSILVLVAGFHIITSRKLCEDKGPQSLPVRMMHKAGQLYMHFGRR